MRTNLRIVILLMFIFIIEVTRWCCRTGSDGVLSHSPPHTQDIPELALEIAILIQDGAAVVRGGGTRSSHTHTHAQAHLH